MDNQMHNPENAWVDGKLAALVPPADWNPNSIRAYNEFLKRRDGNEPKANSSWIRISMASAILASIALIVALLPWQALWKPAAKSAESKIQTEPVKAPTPAVAPEPLRQQTAKLTPPRVSQPELSQPALSQPELSQPALLQPQFSGATQIALAAQEPEQKPAERVGPRATPPRAIAPTIEPNYTDEARQAHIQGTVVLDVIVRKDGTGKVQKVVQSLGYGLDEKAIEAFEKWTFTPGTMDGKPVDVELQVVISFKLY